MASTDGAEKRIAYLLGLPKAGWNGERTRPRSSPAPLNGGEGGVNSYALPILYREATGPMVRPEYLLIRERSSLTTNRHISAGHWALIHNGYVDTGELRERRGHTYAVYAPAPA